MDEEIKFIIKIIGFNINHFEDLNGLTIPRETLLSDDKYDEVKYLIPDLKKNYSSSFMTSLQKNAEKTQKWPLLNLIRQILHVYGYKMEPIRKADGYTLEGVKKYKRYFLICKKNSINEIKKIEFKNDDKDNNIVSEY
jgi:phage terminase large subunit